MALKSRSRILVRIARFSSHLQLIGASLGICGSKLCLSAAPCDFNHSADKYGNSSHGKLDCKRSYDHAAVYRYA
jgi:hypothetical protein